MYMSGILEINTNYLFMRLFNKITDCRINVIFLDNDPRFAWRVRKQTDRQTKKHKQEPLLLSICRLSVLPFVQICCFVFKGVFKICFESKKSI